MSLQHSIQKLKSIGFNPTRILDIGCHHGDWTRFMRQFFPEAKFILIDGIDYPEAKMLGYPHYVEVLNDTITEVEWFEEKNTGDSMFRERTWHFANTKPVMKKTQTLDNFFKNEDSDSEQNNLKFDFIKIDCQGAEIPILKGGANLVSKAEVILLEIPFCGQYNFGVPDFKEHINFMDSIGFVPYDITELHRFDEFLIQIDILFVRKDSFILNKVQSSISK